jgi:hypothetical protein
LGNTNRAKWIRAKWVRAKWVRAKWVRAKCKFRKTSRYFWMKSLKDEIIKR